jgi:hypothetical protein
MKYFVTDSACGSVEKIEADSAEEAAKIFCMGGDWGDGSETTWVDVYVYSSDPDIDDDPDREMVTVTIEPDEPPCTESAHAWKSPGWLGGCSENPGVWGHDGGARGTKVCAHCGIYCDWDSWAQRSSTGQQGLDSVAYRDADEQSLAWINNNKYSRKTVRN